MKLQQELDAIEIPQEIDQMNSLQKLSLFWGVIATILKFVKIFTGKKADEKIDMILEWGNTELPELTKTPHAC